MRHEEARLLTSFLISTSENPRLDGYQVRKVGSGPISAMMEFYDLNTFSSFWAFLNRLQCVGQGEVTYILFLFQLYNCLIH